MKRITISAEVYEAVKKKAIGNFCDTTSTILPGGMYSVEIDDQVDAVLSKASKRIGGSEVDIDYENTIRTMLGMELKKTN